MLHVSWTPRMMKLSFILALFIGVIPIVSAEAFQQADLGLPRTNAQLGDSSCFRHPYRSLRFDRV